MSDWIKDESKIRRHSSKSVCNVDVKCNIEDNKHSTHGEAQLESEVPEACSRSKRPLSVTETCPPPKRRLSSEESEMMERDEKSLEQHSDADEILSLSSESLESLDACTRQQDSDEDLSATVSDSDESPDLFALSYLNTRDFLKTILLRNKLEAAVKDDNMGFAKSLLVEFFNSSDIFVKSRSLDNDREKQENKFQIWRDIMYMTMENDAKYSEEIMKLLLDCDVIWSLENKMDDLLLHRLIRYAYKVSDKTMRLIEMLLKSGNLNVNATDADGCAVLHLVREEKLASLLIRYGADVNRKDNEGKTVLMAGHLLDFMCDSYVSVLQTILDEAGTWVDLDATDCNGRTALIIWAMKKNLNAVELLLNAGASANISDHLGLTALHHALYEIITDYDSFSRNSEELKARKEVMTNLFNAAKTHRYCYWFRKNIEWSYCRMKIVEMLLRRTDVDVNALSFERFSPLDIAEGCIPQSSPCIGNALKQKGATLNAFKRAESQSASDFHLDVRCRLTLQRIICELPVISINDENLLKENFLTLIETFKEQLVSGKDRQGRTALHLAAISFTLISLEIQSTEDFFLTREHYRVVLGKKIVRKLISLGCNVNEVDIYGRTAMDYADKVLQKFFTCKGVDAIAKGKDGKSATDSPSQRFLDISEALYKRYHETCFLHLMNNNKLEINVQLCYSLISRRTEELNPKEVPELLWKDGEYAFRHPLTKQITKEVMDLMDVIAKEIERLDPRFEVRPEFVGSSNEGTKLDKPDQFDFCFVLTKISELCEVSQSPELPTGFVRIKRKQTKVGKAKGNDFDDLFKEDGILNTGKLDWQIRTILMNAVIYIESQQSFDFNLEMQISRLNSRSSILTNSWGTILKASNIKMLKPLNFSSVNIISIDIVPCIRVDGWWPDEAISNVSEDIMKFGCNLVFDIPQQQYPWVPYSDSCARISFAKAESDTIKQTCVKAKEAYMIGKTMIEKSEWYPKETFNHILRNCLLYCIEALTPTSDKASKLGLSLEELESKFHQMNRLVWLKCLMKCHLYFIAQDFCPCYFLPHFSLPIGKEYVIGKEVDRESEYLKHFSRRWMMDGNDKFPDLCRKVYTCYCCTSSAISESCCHMPAPDPLWKRISESFLQLPAPDPLWERFDRDKLIANLCEVAYK